MDSGQGGAVELEVKESGEAQPSAAATLNGQFLLLCYCVTSVKPPSSWDFTFLYGVWEINASHPDP